MGASRSAPAVWLRGTGDSWDSRRGAMQGSRANAPNDAKAQDERRVPAARLGMMSCHRVPLPSRRTLGGPCDQRSALACDPPPHLSLLPSPLQIPLPRRPPTPPKPWHPAPLFQDATWEHPSTAQGISIPWTLDITVFHLLAPRTSPFPDRVCSRRRPSHLDPRCWAPPTWGDDTEAQPALRNDVAVGGSASGTANLCLVAGRRPLDESFCLFQGRGIFFFFIWDCRLVKVVGLVDMLGDKSD